MRAPPSKAHKKIGTILTENLIVRAKRVAESHNTTLSRVFEEALTEYLNRHASLRPKPSNVEASFGVFPLSLNAVRTIEQDDTYAAD